MPERPQSILVIEDDPAVAEALVEGIGNEGYDVHWEATGAGGVAYARDRSPQLIVLDVRLPDGSRLRLLPRRCASSACASPSSCSPCSPTRSTRSSASRWAPTTTSPSPTTCASSSPASARCCGAPTASSPPPRPTSLYADDLTIDRTRATVTRDGRALNLTPTEFRLLVFLAQHPGQVFSRAPAHRERLGQRRRLLRRQDRERPRAPPAREDRGRAQRPAHRADRARHRLPARRRRMDGHDRRTRAPLRSPARALTYAGIALLTALILGGILLGVLGSYYARAEERYLRAGAELVAAEPLPLDDPGGARPSGRRARRCTRRPACASSTPSGALARRLRTARHARRRRHAAPRPTTSAGTTTASDCRDLLGGGLFGGSGSGARSDRTLELPIAGGGRRATCSSPRRRRRGATRW